MKYLPDKWQGRIGNKADRTRLIGSYFFICVIMNPVLIFGAGPLGKMALDILQSNQVVVYGFLDDRPELAGQEIGEVPVLGTMDDDGFLKLIGKKCDALVAAESSKERIYLFDLLNERRHLMPINAIHNLASVSGYAALGHGNLLAAGSRIAAFAQIGNGNVFHPNSVVEGNCIIGSQVIIGSGAIIGSETTIEDNAFIGPGVTVIGEVRIGKNASVGAGSVVLADVPASSKMFGYPAQKV